MVEAGRGDVRGGEERRGKAREGEGRRGVVRGFHNVRPGADGYRHFHSFMGVWGGGRGCGREVKWVVVGGHGIMG